MLDPVGRHPTGGMPGYKLEAEDVDRLVAYMSTFRLKRQPGDAKKTPQRLADAARRSIFGPANRILDPDVLTAVKAPIRKRFCYACHSPENTPVDGPKLDPATARWTAGCLRSDRAASIAPQFTLRPADRAAVVAFLRRRPQKALRRGLGGSGPAIHRPDGLLLRVPQARRKGRRAARAERWPTSARPRRPAAPDPLSPPDLSGVGTRLVRPWMLETLAGNSPSNRPWLKVKMPNYGLSDAERSRIAARLAVADEIPDLAAPREKGISKALEATAATLTSNRGFNCVNCHFLGAKAYQPTSSAPDFTMAPAGSIALVLPVAFQSGRESCRARRCPRSSHPVSGIAGDDLAVQKEIIWRFLQGKPAASRARATRRAETARP